MLYIVAIFFDILAFICILPAMIPYAGWALGILAIFLNIFAGLIFLTWFLIWKSKGVGESKYFRNIIKCWLVEEVPVVGSFMPTWTFMIYRAENMYGGGPINSVAGQLKNIPKTNNFGISSKNVPMSQKSPATFSAIEQRQPSKIISTERPIISPQKIETIT